MIELGLGSIRRHKKVVVEEFMRQEINSKFHYKRTSCRVCGNSDLQVFLKLGPTPLANAFLQTPSQFSDESFYPLDVYYCMTCSLVQLLDVIDPDILFRNYIYLTGTSDTIAHHNIQYAQSVVNNLNLAVDDLVVEVASNDGSLLRCFQKHEVRTLGIEPAINVANIANSIGVETINKFFNLSTAQQVRKSHGLAKAVIANNVLAHVDETKDFLRGCRELLAENGLIIIEVPYLRDLIDRLEYDTIYHEHLCYFSVSSLMHLCNEVNLSIIQIEKVPVHGGSIRIYMGKTETYTSHGSNVLEISKEETNLGLNDISRYTRFAIDVENNRYAMKELLESLESQGKTIAGYGAPAKGNTLLNYNGIDTSILPFIVDKNPLKVGLYTPGTHIPVRPVSELLKQQPDYMLILAWNFADEIMRQQKIYSERGGRYIIPIPEPKVI